jgi:ADP-heptose:LPS heptosyltransferase
VADRLVVLRRGALGDVVLLGAVTSAWPGPVTVVCDPRWAEVAGALMGVEQVLPWGSPVPQGRVVDLQGGWRGRLSGSRVDARIRKRSIRRRVGLLTGWRLGRPTVPALYAEAVGVPLHPAPWVRQAKGPRDILALIPGAAWGPKRWDPSGFAALGARWSGPVAILGGPDERALVQQVHRLLPGAQVVCELGFARTLDVLGRTLVAVAGDTGLMHLAGASGAAVVALFGPTHPSDGFFVYRGEVVQRLDLDCRPCTLHRLDACPLGHHRCMALDSERVWEAIVRCAG